MNKILKISVWVLTIAAIACLWYFTHKDHVEHPLKGVEITLDRATEKGFIDKNAVHHQIMKICDTVHNKDITSPSTVIFMEKQVSPSITQRCCAITSAFSRP